MTIEKLILSALPATIQCNNNKADNYKLNVPKTYALNNYNFIQFRHPKYHKFISIDVDSKKEIKSFSDIYNICIVNNIPAPTICVETNKGWHIHWALKEPVWRNNEKLMNWLKDVRKELNDIFGGDPNFASFIVRNPLKHNYFYAYKEYEYKDFYELASLESYEKKQKEPKKRYRGRKFYDFTKVKVGERNTNLYNYLRQFGYVNYKNINIDDMINEAKRVNNLMPVPQSVNEVVSVAISVWDYVKRTYEEKRSSGYQTIKNRELAQQKKEKTIEKIKDNIVSASQKNIISISMFLLQMYSKKFMARLTKVDVKTFRKHIETIIKKILNWIREGKGQYIKFSVNSFEYNVLKYNSVLVVDVISLTPE